MEYTKKSTCYSNNAIIQIQSTPPKRKAELENENTDISTEESDSQSSPKKLNTSLAEEDHLAQFFHEALIFMQKTMKVSEEELQKAISTVIESFKYHEGKRFSDIDFHKSENLCAYFYRYSPLSAQLSRRKISEAISNCKTLQFCLNRREINVVSIGGGAGCDIVGMCSALYKKVFCSKLNFIVIDKAKRWKSFLNIAECLLLDGDFGDASSMFKESDASISFICEDVCNFDTQKRAYYEVLTHSDVIVMKSILSILPFPLKNFLAKVSNSVRFLKK